MISTRNWESLIARAVNLTELGQMSWSKHKGHSGAYQYEFGDPELKYLVVSREYSAVKNLHEYSLSTKTKTGDLVSMITTDELAMYPLAEIKPDLINELGALWADAYEHVLHCNETWDGLIKSVFDGDEFDSDQFKDEDEFRLQAPFVG